jgi:hypothetical protein
MGVDARPRPDRQLQALHGEGPENCGDPPRRREPQLRRPSQLDRTATRNALPHRGKSAGSSVPFLRVIRDKRGYETTYLMHWYREGNRQRSRILYVFRTPGGVRVGRDPLDSDIQQEIEDRYPDIQFDWNSVLENQQLIETTPDLRRGGKRRRGEDEGSAAAPAAAAPTGSVAPTAQPPRMAVPRKIEGATPDEQIEFLTRWYAVVRERIPVRTSDSVRQAALMALAERLNPAAWTDADQITTGLQQAGEALERLSHVFGKRRRRTRRPSTASAPPQGQSIDASAPDPEPSESGSGARSPVESGSDTPSDNG